MLAASDERLHGWVISLGQLALMQPHSVREMLIFSPGSDSQMLAALNERLHGWMIPPGELEICVHADGGGRVLLGSGSFGNERAVPSASAGLYPLD